MPGQPHQLLDTRRLGVCARCLLPRRSHDFLEPSRSRYVFGRSQRRSRSLLPGPFGQFLGAVQFWSGWLWATSSSIKPIFTAGCTRVGQPRLHSNDRLTRSFAAVAQGGRGVLITPDSETVSVSVARGAAPERGANETARGTRLAAGRRISRSCGLAVRPGPGSAREGRGAADFPRGLTQEWLRGILGPPGFRPRMQSPWSGLRPRGWSRSRARGAEGK